MSKELSSVKPADVVIIGKPTYDIRIDAIVNPTLAERTRQPKFLLETPPVPGAKQVQTKEQMAEMLHDIRIAGIPTDATVGGGAPNAAVNTQKALGTERKVKLITAIGDDESGHEIHLELRRREVRYQTEQAEEGTPTAVIILPKTRDGRVLDRETRGYNPDTMSFPFGLNGHGNPDAVWLNSIAGDWRKTSASVLTQLDGRDGILFGVTLGTATLKQGVKDPEIIGDVVARADFIAQNVEEGRRLLEILGQKDHNVISPAEVTYRIQQIGREKTVLISDGSNGAKIGYQGEILHGDIIPANEISTLGAGDGAASAAFARRVMDRKPAAILAGAIANGAAIVEHAGSLDGGLSEEGLQESTEKHEKAIKMQVVYKNGDFLREPQSVSLR